MDALTALHTIEPELNVTPPVGLTSPLMVRVRLRGTTLANALRAVEQQGEDIADVVWDPTHPYGGDEVFIRFRTPPEQPRLAPTATTN